MSNHQERAVALFKEGYNCAQSVFAAYCDEIGMDFETALKLSSSFGGGMGRLREVCGAVSGMFMVVGAKYGYSDPKDSQAKEKHYRLIQALAKRFEEQNGSIICRELLGLDHVRDNPTPDQRNDAYYKKRPCVELVRCAAEIVDEYMEEHEMKIAITTQDGQVFQHFGRCEDFTVFTIADGKIQDRSMLDTNGNGHAALAGILQEAGVGVLICGGIGGGAQQMLSAAGIQVISGIEGSIDEAIAAYLAGNLTDQNGGCNHEDHGEEHDCSCENSCG